MPDWTLPMQQSFEYYVVDPNTWKEIDKLNNVTSCTITRDLEAETLGSATIDMVGSIGEKYIRVYLITLQNGVKERHPLGTFLVQTPSVTFNGLVKTESVDAYTPLIELKENPPPIGYFVPKNANIMERVYQIVREHARAPVVSSVSTEIVHKDFVSSTEDTWMSFTKDLMANAKHEFALDEMGRILFAPKQEIDALQPVYTYDDSDKSILYRDITLKQDLYKVPNAVEVICSSGTNTYMARVVNDDPNSETSTVSRGREILHRVTNPGFAAPPTNRQLDIYAKQMLKDLSSVEYRISYSHGYCGTRLGDCVRINYERAGMSGIKAKIISQTIKCTPGCPVSESAIFVNKFWR